MVSSSKLPAIDRTVHLRALGSFAHRLSKVTDELREQILAPRPRKNPPTFTSSQVADMCGIDRARLAYLANREGSTLPSGTLHGNGRSRQFTLAEARQWVQQTSEIVPSPLLAGKKGQAAVVVSANFKGGSTKTTTALCVAQGLSLRGRKVLIIDLDPQASMTEMCGLYAEKEVDEEQTVLPLVYATSPDDFKLESVVQETYWDGIHIIPAHPSLFAAEFHLPATTNNTPGYQFWTILREGLKPLREQYDFIIVDTAPSLSYLTINGLMAADAMMIPLVPESLDFISSVSFWSLFADLSETFLKYEPEKAFDFVSVLLSKVDYGQTSSAPVVRAWAQRAYGDWLSVIEIPSSSAMSNGALALATVFDIGRNDVGAKTLQRVRQPLEDYCKWLDDQYTVKWGATQ